MKKKQENNDAHVKMFLMEESGLGQYLLIFCFSSPPACIFTAALISPLLQISFAIIILNDDLHVLHV